MKVWFETVPKYNCLGRIKEGEQFVSSSGVIDVEERHHKDVLFHLVDYVGLFKHDNGFSNFHNVERDLVQLNGCEVEVIIKIIKFPKEEQKEGLKDAQT